MTSSNGTFSALPAPCEGNAPITGGFPSQRPVTRSFDVLFYLRLKNGWANNCHAGDLRRHCAHFDVTVMMKIYQVHLGIQFLFEYNFDLLNFWMILCSSKYIFRQNCNIKKVLLVYVSVVEMVCNFQWQYHRSFKIFISIWKGLNKNRSEIRMPRH